MVAGGELTFCWIRMDVGDWSTGSLPFTVQEKRIQVQLVNEIQGRQSRSKGRQGEVKQSNSKSLNSLLTAEEDGVGLGDDDEGQRDEEESDDDD